MVTEGAIEASTIGDNQSAGAVQKQPDEQPESSPKSNNNESNVQLVGEAPPLPNKAPPLPHKEPNEDQLVSKSAMSPSENDSSKPDKPNVEDKCEKPALNELAPQEDLSHQPHQTFEEQDESQFADDVMDTLSDHPTELVAEEAVDVATKEVSFLHAQADGINAVDTLEQASDKQVFAACPPEYWTRLHSNFARSAAQPSQPVTEPVSQAAPLQPVQETEPVAASVTVLACPP